MLFVFFCIWQVQARDPPAFVDQFHTALSQYLHALQAIIPVFNYMVSALFVF